MRHQHLSFLAIAVAVFVTQVEAHGQSFDFVNGDLQKLPPVNAVHLQPHEQETTIRQASFSEAVALVTSGGGGGNGWLHSAQFFGGGDAWAARLDDDDSNSFGARAGFNLAHDIRSSGWLGQFGASYGVYDWDGHEQGDTGDNEEQFFGTFGVTRLADPCCGRRVSAAIVADYLRNENVGEEHNQTLDLWQVRYRLGYAVSDLNEFGVRGATQLGPDEPYLSLNAGPLAVGPLDYMVAYWDRSLANGGRIETYFGWLSEPGELMMGVNAEVPINERWAMYGSLMYGKPSTSPGDLAPNGVEQSYSEAYWNVGMGFVFYLRGSSCDRLLPVANNSNFLVRAPVGAL